MGNQLKKPAAVFAVSVLLALTGCSPKLSTTETCVELQAILSFSEDGVWTEPPAAQAEFFDMVDKLAARSSETLKDFVVDIGLANEQRVKPVKDQDTAKLERIQERIDAKWDMVQDVCRLKL